MADLIGVEMDGVRFLFGPVGAEVFLELSPAKNSPTLYEGYLDDVVVPHAGRVYVPVAWMKERYREALPQFQKMETMVRERCAEEL